MGKQIDADIQEVLDFCEEWVEAISGGDAADDNGCEDVDGDVRGFRQVETVVRRLAREAGYELPAG